jgi:molybdopterin converting factor small subunit
MAYLSERYGAPMRKMLYTPDGEGIGQDAIILVNGQNVAHLGGKHTALKESDAVSIFPMVAGG